MFQPIKISRLAENVFEEEGQINISGHGMLRKMFLSAYLSENKSQLEPPREHYYFNRNSHSAIDAKLVRKVATYFILTEQEAEIQVQLWEKKFLEKVRISDQRFGPFGTFSFNDQLDFLADSPFIYEWLPSIPYQPEGTIPNEHIKSEIALPDKRSNKRSIRKRKVLFPALWSILAFLFVFALFFWSKPLNLLLDKNTELSTRLVNVAPESYSENENLDYFSDTHEVQTTNEKSELMAVDTLDVHLNLPVDNKPSISNDPVISHLNDYETKHPDEMNTDPKIGKEEVKHLPVEPPVASSQRCTLILGAFANPDNVDKMVSKLGEYNFEAVTMKRKTLTLVGALVTCSDNPQINLLKNQIEPNAWMYNQ